MASLNSVHPRKAVAFYQGRHSGNSAPALLWLFLAVALVVTIRNGALPSMSQAITLALAAAIIVGIGQFAPELVTLLLVALLIAGVLDVPGIGPFLAQAQGRVAGLTTRAGG